MGDIGVGVNLDASLRNDEVEFACLRKSNKEFFEIDLLYLGHAPDTIADRYYVQAPQQALDEEIA